MEQTIKIEIANEQDFRNYFYQVIAEEVQKIKEDVSYGKPLNQKQIAKFLGVSPATVRDEYETSGMPFGWIKSRKFYDPIKCKEWVTSQKIDMQ